jgi:hypothetical protein
MRFHSATRLSNQTLDMPEVVFGHPPGSFS